MEDGGACADAGGACVLRRYSHVVVVVLSGSVGRVGVGVLDHVEGGAVDRVEVGVVDHPVVGVVDRGEVGVDDPVEVGVGDRVVASVGDCVEVGVGDRVLVDVDGPVEVGVVVGAVAAAATPSTCCGLSNTASPRRCHDRASCLSIHFLLQTASFLWEAWCPRPPKGSWAPIPFLFCVTISFDGQSALRAACPLFLLLSSC